jgi:hypothetical protein
MGRILHDLMFVENQPEIFFTTMYLGVLVLVIQGLVMYPPRMFRMPGKEGQSLQLAA